MFLNLIGMKPIVLIFIFLCVNIFSTHSQKYINSKVCGHDLVMNAMEKEYPGFKDQVKKVFDNAKRASQFNSRFDGEQLIVPVVLHVVWKTDEENISDDLINRQLKVLNEVFNLENGNRNELRDIFKDRQTNPNIKFELQEVKRVKTTANFALSFTLQLPDNVKNARDGSLAVDPDNVLNIWICKIQPIPFIGGQILGYAYPPAGLSNWPQGASAPSRGLDGVVLDFRVVGPDNPVKLDIQGRPFESQGLTIVHEIGHYLGLRHIWGDGGIFGGNSCTEDDGVEDTPNQGSSSDFNCDFTQNTCTDAQSDLPDMIENYMDYSSEECQNTFTKGQVAIMRAVLRNERNGLISSSNQWMNPSKFRIYPNPSTNIIHFDYHSDFDRISIVDIYGNVLIQKDNSAVNIDISHLANGTYIMKIYAQDGVSTSPFVKF